jgi:hypothetical protein
MVTGVDANDVLKEMPKRYAIGLSFPDGQWN